MSGAALLRDWIRWWLRPPSRAEPFESALSRADARWNEHDFERYDANCGVLVELDQPDSGQPISQ